MRSRKSPQGTAPDAAVETARNNARQARPERRRRARLRGLAAPLLPFLLAAFCSYGFLGFEKSPAAVGNDLFAQGKYDEAIQKYGEALVDDSDSPVLNFNMGDAHYKAGNYSEALASFGRVHAPTDSQREAYVAYNVGNVKFRMAAAVEAEKPQDGLKAYAEALAAYRRALGISPNDEDAKFNYELAAKRMKELQERIEKEKQEQEQQQEEQQQNEQPQEEQPQDQQQQDQAQQDQQQQDQGEQQQQQEQQNQGEQQQQPEGDQQQQQQAQPQGEPGEQQEQQAAEAGEKDEMSEGEASTLVDAARNDELRPEDFVRRAQGGALAAPAQDW
jgi:Ca-activated chloride channel family protein